LLSVILIALSLRNVPLSKPCQSNTSTGASDRRHGFQEAKRVPYCHYQSTGNKNQRRNAEKQG
jgi:hypothetical protein